ncbi:MAG TPA: formate dehydrogenase accessory sulfurtransferase FdhD [Phototrophicaceae bacterium]|jgi:FdhD protein|nr:formate dehydrogenase accessory sulfurtransferase FdhD [Phototrophicaceae bacterium]
MDTPSEGLPGSKTALNVIRVRDGRIQRLPRRDEVATEEPLEIRLVTPHETRQLAVTMRTPGADFELAAGFLFAEGIIHHRSDIKSITYCVDRELDEDQRYNVVNVTLYQPPAIDLDVLNRHFTMSSACGVCGRASLDALERDGLVPLPDRFQVSTDYVTRLPEALRQAQKVFSSTGGLHAAALFDLQGNLLAVREDVGRHNALDKLIGWAIMQNRTPLDQCVVLVSGRASFELLQKALMAGISVFCAISAPSSLAVSLARRFNITLIGFLRENNFNLYCGQQRLVE